MRARAETLSDLALISEYHCIAGATVHDLPSVDHGKANGQQAESLADSADIVFPRGLTQGVVGAILALLPPVCNKKGKPC